MRVDSSGHQSLFTTKALCDLFMSFYVGLAMTPVLAEDVPEIQTVLRVGMATMGLEISKFRSAIAHNPT